MKFIAGLFAISVIVLLHELAHFLAAKASGVAVEAFSIGFGPVLIHAKLSGTDFRFSLIPLGGYCAMKSEGEASLPLCSPVKKFFIAFAGPFANLSTAFMCFFCVFLVGREYETFSCKVLIDENSSSPACVSGMKTGDIVEKVNGEEVSTFLEIKEKILACESEVISIVVLRDGKEIHFSLKVEINEAGEKRIGIKADKASLVTKRIESEPFTRAFSHAALETCNALSETVQALASLLTFKKGETLQGPVRTAAVLGEALHEGGAVFLFVVAYISISLFIFNLLPFPPLDGAICIFSLFEVFTRKKVSSYLEEKLKLSGSILLIFLACYVLVKDILSFF